MKKHILVVDDEQSIRDLCRELLEDEGYTKFFDFEDSSNVEADCDTVDDYEVSNDIVFIYVFGHGHSCGDDYEYSYTIFDATHPYIRTYSTQFRGYLDRWESNQKFILVESCQSGNWVNDFDDTPYVAISTSDETHYSYPTDYTIPGEGKFSYYFFKHVNEGYNALNSFVYAESHAWIMDILHKLYQHPKMCYNTGYAWFGTPSSWFEN